MNLRALGALLLCFTLSGVHAPSASAEPAWFKRKKQVQEDKEEEERIKAEEEPIVGTGADGGDLEGGGFSSFGKKEEKPRTWLLFRKEGVTESLSLDFGKINQQDIPGNIFSALYSTGWWASPHLTLSGAGRVSSMFMETFYYMTAHVGPQARWVPNKHWAISAFAGYGIGQGLNRVSQAHIPRPPAHHTLRIRHGFLLGAEVTKLFQTKKRNAFGPTLGAWLGKHGDRTSTSFNLGITFQAKRPNYTGDLSAKW